MSLYDGSTLLQTVKTTGGTVTIPSGSLTAGNHAITANYSGTARKYGAASSTIYPTVGQAVLPSVTSVQL